MPISPADAGIIWRHFCDGNRPPTSPRDMARAIERWFCWFPNSSDLWRNIKPLAVTLRKAALATHQPFGLHDELTADEVYAWVLDDLYEILRNSKNRSEFKLRFLSRFRDAAVAASPPDLLHEKTRKTLDAKRWGDLPGKLAGLSREVFAEEEGAMTCLKAAEEGNVVAQGELGVRYYWGLGIKPNRSAAIFWLQRGVSQGDAGAQAFLARCYGIGAGVEKNHSEEFRLAKESAEQGHPMGQLWLGHCFYCGWGVEKDHRQALSWYFLAADQELPAAEALLGKAFEDGDVFAQNFVEAAKWYRRAKEHGDSSAEDSLERLKVKMTPAQIESEDMLSEAIRQSDEDIGPVHGPFKVTCSACGEHYWPDEREEHLEVCGHSQGLLDWGQSTRDITIWEVAHRHGLGVQEALVIANEIGISIGGLGEVLPYATYVHLEREIIARREKAKEAEGLPPQAS